MPRFETLGIVPGRNVDYVIDASEPLPFHDGTFELVYASHVLEHIPWYFTERALREWVRILAPGGTLEVWVPDGLKLCEALVALERDGIDPSVHDHWYRLNPDKNPYMWIAGRVFTYGDGSGRRESPNWHRAMFTPKYLRQLLEQQGLEVDNMDRSEVRGDDHGWINLGMRGTKR